MTLADAAPAPADGMPRAADAVVRMTRILALGCVIGLIVLGLAWELWLAPTGSGTLALKVLPLLLPLPGPAAPPHVHLPLAEPAGVDLFHRRRRARHQRERRLDAVLAIVEVVLCLVLFAACALHVRWRITRARALA